MYMNYTLGIDTSSSLLSLSLLCDGQAYINFSRYINNSHAEHITHAMNFMLESSMIKPEEITNAGIVNGPGSFTGLRIGISFLKGFLFKRETPVMAISSMHCMATAFILKDCSITTVIDARQNSVFYARFTKKNGKCERITPDTLISIDRFISMDNSDDIVLIDTLCYSKSVLYNVFQQRDNAYFTENIILERGFGAALIAYSASDDKTVWKKSFDIQPEYMQPSYAESKIKK